MTPQPKKKLKSYMKPVAKRVTIQKPQPKRKKKVAVANILPGGFTRINDSKIRKVYK